jgi:acetyl esterase/lipase
VAHRPNRYRGSAVVLLAAAVCVGALWLHHPDAPAAPADRVAPGATTAPAAARDIPIKSWIAYAKRGDENLHMDMARPEGAGPFPAVVCIHGGGWEIGHRVTHHRTIRLLAAHGYVAVSIDYRLAPKHKFPAQIEDAKAAVRFLRSGAADYGIDPLRIAAMGESAGGHLALLLGTLDEKDGLDGQGDGDRRSSKVAAVVNYFGPTDLTRWKIPPLVDDLLHKKFGRRSDSLLENFLGTCDRKAPIMVQASPINYIDAGDAPVLTFHGLLDPIVPAEQAILLHEALRKAGVAEKLVTLPMASHGWGGAERERTDRLMVEFLDGRMK